MQETSIEAFESVLPKLPSIYKKALDIIREFGEFGLTAEELHHRYNEVWGTDVAYSTVRSATAPLRRALLIRDSGHRRSTSTGRRAIVWVAIR